MKTKLLPLTLLCVVGMTTGCSQTIQDNDYTQTSSVNDNFYIYTDPDTCVEYFVSWGGYNIGTVLPRYNQEGSLKLNQDCLERSK